MKTKFRWFTLLASAAMLAQAQAGGYHGGGGGFGRGFASVRSAPSRAGAVSSFRSTPGRSFGNRPIIYSGRRVTMAGAHSPGSVAGRQQHIRPNTAGSAVGREFAAGNISHGNNVDLAANAHRTTSNRQRSANAAAQVRNGDARLRPGWRNHVFAQRSANWQRNWDRRRDHWWHGHRCHFVNGSWFIFDLGFYPWWPYGYPYDYYDYPYADSSYYDSDYDDSDAYQGNGYNDQRGNGVSADDTASVVGAAQEQLAHEGYYRGAIDGVLGPATRRAIVGYQSRHGLRVTGYLTSETLQALGLGNLAIN